MRQDVIAAAEQALEALETIQLLATLCEESTREAPVARLAPLFLALADDAWGPVQRLLEAGKAQA